MASVKAEPGHKKYDDLIDEMKEGQIQIPKFQRDLVWSIDKTADLLDSILKGYPIGTFILWEPKERFDQVKKIGDWSLPEIPEGKSVNYVLDGQQRIVSLYAVYQGKSITKSGKKTATDYKKIVVNLDKDALASDAKIVTAKRVKGKRSISLHKVLKFDITKPEKLEENVSPDEIGMIAQYQKKIENYLFSIIFLKQADIDLAVEVFNRINTTGKQLTPFEIMSAKTYDEGRGFDMQDRWDKLVKKENEYGLKDYNGISNMVILYLLSLLISPSTECKAKTIYSLKKDDIIDKWDAVIDALKCAIGDFQSYYKIPVSRILPYDYLLVPFAYFFHKNENQQPNYQQRKWLDQYFWSAALSGRYSGPVQTNLAQDVRDIQKILHDNYPEIRYKDNIRIAPQTLIETQFNKSSSYCKAVLCLLASKEPHNFDRSGKVILDNSFLQQSNSKNDHHFFPKAALKSKGISNENSLMNITLISDDLNKNVIGSKWPSNYIAGFKEENTEIDSILETHFIKQNGFGIENDDYKTFLEARAKLISAALKSKIDSD
ncbi:MAG: DUF262 domain-containing protein [Chromatiales bacterium]|nr:DUF262 domain-containing protein [Chromatiales bacterium]